MQAWEYKTVSKEENEEEEGMTDEELNALGQQGWELVSVIIDEQTVVDVGRTVSKRVRVHYFKRSVS